MFNASGANDDALAAPSSTHSPMFPAYVASAETRFVMDSYPPSIICPFITLVRPCSKSFQFLSSFCLATKFSVSLNSLAC